MTLMPPRNYYNTHILSRNIETHQAALQRCVARLKNNIPIIGLRNTKIGSENFSWHYGSDADWTISFHTGQLWLAYQLSGDACLSNNARARRPAFEGLLRKPALLDHDTGFQFSLSAVAEWRMTGDERARDMALTAARFLRARFNPAGEYIQAWNPSPADPARSAFVAGRVIADSMENLPLLYWAYQETGIEDFRDIANQHADTVQRHVVRADGTSFHTFVFDPASGQPLRGETHQGYAHDSCWSRGQAWLIHGFAQAYAYTGNLAYLDTARKLADRAEILLGNHSVPLWDYALPAHEPQHLDSSAAAITAAGLFLLASHTKDEEAARWRGFADRLLNGLLEHCDLTTNPDAQGFLDHGAANVNKGASRNMLPYGDYFFMEALMRSLGHTQFFW